MYLGDSYLPGKGEYYLNISGYHFQFPLSMMGDGQWTTPLNYECKHFAFHDWEVATNTFAIIYLNIGIGIRKFIWFFLVLRVDLDVDMPYD